MIFDMLAGRLELFPLLLLFHPVIIKEMFEDKRRYKKAKKCRECDIRIFSLM